MSTILTETSTFTATVTVPSDGDAGAAASVITGMQSLTNRTKYLYDQGVTQGGYITLLNRLLYWAEFVPTGAAWSTASKLPLSESADPMGAFSVSSGDITVPAAGWYMVSGIIRAVSATPYEETRFTVRKNTTVQCASRMTGYVIDGSLEEIAIDGVFRKAVSIADTATDKINIYQSTGNIIDYVATLGGDAASHIHVQYIGPII